MILIFLVYIIFKGPVNFLFISDVNKIMMVNLDEGVDTKSKVLYYGHHESRIISLAYDDVNDMLHWIDQSQ